MPATEAVRTEVRLYDRLFRVEQPDADPDADFKTHLNPESLKVTAAYVEPALLQAAPGERFQFERIGYFCADAVDSRPGAPVFNQTVSLKDTWARIAAQG